MPSQSWESYHLERNKDMNWRFKSMGQTQRRQRPRYVSYLNSVYRLRIGKYGAA